MFITAMQFEYLNNLQASGATNMLGAGPYLEQNFGLNKKEAINILKQWMALKSKEVTHTVSLGDILDSMGFEPYNPVNDTLENQLQLLEFSFKSAAVLISKGTTSKSQLERLHLLIGSVLEKL